jgi:hypothetical protein
MKLFLSLFVPAALVTASAIVFAPGLKSVLHSSAGGGSAVRESVRTDRLFKDVSPGDEFAAEIAYMRNKGLARGFEDGTYRPSDPVRREEFIKLVVAAAKADPHPVSNSHCFKDVGNEWFARYVCYAKKKGLVMGYEDGRFGTGSYITVKEAETIIGRSFGKDLKDAAEESGSQFLPSGMLPDSELTRAQAAGLVVRALNAANAAR